MQKPLFHLSLCTNIAYTWASTLCTVKNLVTRPHTWPVSTLILDHRVAWVLPGETDRGLCGQSCLNSGTPNQSSPSLSVSPSVFLIAHSPPSTRRWRSCVVKSWEWTIRQPPYPLLSLQLMSLSLSVCWLYTTQPYYLPHPVFVMLQQYAYSSSNE